MVIHFDDLAIGAKFTLTNTSTRSYEKIEPFYYERNGIVYHEVNNIRVYNLPTAEKINKRKMNAHMHNDIRRSCGLVKTPYGWE